MYSSNNSGLSVRDRMYSMAFFAILHIVVLDMAQPLAACVVVDE